MLKMLIVDDDWLISDSLKSLDEWHERNIDVVGTAENGKEAIFWMEQENLDIILTDIRMPEMNGIELTKHIYERNSNIQVIIMSGYEEFSYAQKAMKYNAKGYVLKPIDTDELMETIDRIQKDINPMKNESSHPENEPTTYHDRLVLSAQSYILANLMKSLTLKEIANRLHLTDHYFGQVFKSVTGETFLNYLTRVRMEKASELTKNPNLKIYEIGSLVGYKDPKSFTKTFQKVFNMTPNEFRKQYFVNEKQ
ncbi:response regulator transcription factor [Fredinandcohnia sp. FSL W7-1320]|uniref:response regulator transcription factor n=1 Tax=Fredinandcohnia sp. FSL W7-1320 TaxID=2954540 RepID=UPI0030FD4174